MEDKPFKGVRKQLFVVSYTNPNGGADLLIKVEATNATSARQVARLQLHAKYGNQYKYISILEVTQREEYLHEKRIM